MAKQEILWVSDSGCYFKTKEEAERHDQTYILIKELNEICNDRHSAYMIQKNKKKIYNILKKYYEKGGNI